MNLKKFLKAKDGLISIMNNINKCLENPDIDVLFKIEFGFSLSRNDLNKLANEYNKIKDDKNNEFVKQLETKNKIIIFLVFILRNFIILLNTYIIFKKIKNYLYLFYHFIMI